VDRIGDLGIVRVEPLGDVPLSDGLFGIPADVSNDARFVMLLRGPE
jgi:hypothetical protein